MFATHCTNILVSVLLFGVIFTGTSAKDKYEIRGKDIECMNPNAGYIRNVSCTSRTLNRTTRAYSLGIRLQPNVKIVWLHLKLSTLYKFGVAYRQLLLRGDVDACAVLNGKADSPILQALVNATRTNLGAGCPFEDTIYIENFMISKDTLAVYLPYVPVGQWRYDLDVYAKRDRGQPEELILSGRWFIDVHKSTNRFRQ